MIFSFNLILFLVSTCLFLGLLNPNDDVTAAPVINISEVHGSWEDTFNDTSGIETMNGVILNEEEDYVLLDMDGCYNNFDNESIGFIKNWTYEFSSNIMNHNIINDPFYPGKCLSLKRNDNLASFAWHKLWKQYNDTYYELIKFDLTPFSMEGTEVQAYFYTKFIDVSDSVLHEVRYYWDDKRSGVPSNSASLTAVDLGWVIPNGAPNTMGDVKHFFDENLSSDVDSNPNVSLNTLLQNTKNVKYGFYQDAGTGWLQVDQVDIDNLTIRKPNYYGYLQSIDIAPNDLVGWNNLTVLKAAQRSSDYITVSVLDAATDTPLSGFADLTSSNIDLSSIDVSTYPSIKLYAKFYGNFWTPALHGWNISWTPNNKPVVDNFTIDVDTTRTLLRTNSAVISSVGIDSETPASELKATFQYMDPGNTTWQTAYLSSPVFSNGWWAVTITPPANAQLGYYDIRVQFEDPMNAVSGWWVSWGGIRVMNNLPSAPVVEILPSLPTTTDDLHANITLESVDAENEPITYTFIWYKNNESQEDLQIFNTRSLTTSVLSDKTLKDENWKCLALPFDGNDIGPGGEAEVTIMNSKPHQAVEFANIVMLEDSVLVLENKLRSVFEDIDSDELTYKAFGSENIKVNVFQANGTVTFTPKANWFGTEDISFHANDSFINSSLITVQVKVEPQNDLPIITKVGPQFTSIDYSYLEFSANQDDWLNLSVIVEDIDGDEQQGKVTYHLDITARDNLYFDPLTNELKFLPGNSDVGWHFLNISVTDNNETPPVYITQKIGIQVINVNDPPSVEIIEPAEGQQFFETGQISFDCNGDDIDLLIPDSTEKLTYKWYVRSPEYKELGLSKNISGIVLKSGEYNITVEVTDSSNAVAVDFVNIMIIEEKVIKPEEEITENFLWLGIIIVIIIVTIIVAILFFIIFKKLKKQDQLSGAELSPGTAGAQAAPTPLSAQPPAEGLPQQPQVAPLSTQQPQLALPVTTPQQPVYTQGQQPQTAMSQTQPAQPIHPQVQQSQTILPQTQPAQPIHPVQQPQTVLPQTKPSQPVYAQGPPIPPQIYTTVQPKEIVQEKKEVKEAVVEKEEESKD
jgi:hypothetical protein